MELYASMDEFLRSAHLSWPNPDVRIKTFPTCTGETIACVLWQGRTYVTGTDVVKVLVHRLTQAGRSIVNMKKLEECVFGDLRTVRVGVGCDLEQPRSAFLEFLHENDRIRTKKKQKVFYWDHVHHDKIFADCLEREMKRNGTGKDSITVPTSFHPSAHAYHHQPHQQHHQHHHHHQQQHHHQDPLPHHWNLAATTGVGFPKIMARSQSQPNILPHPLKTLAPTANGGMHASGGLQLDTADAGWKSASANLYHQISPASSTTTTNSGHMNSSMIPSAGHGGGASGGDLLHSGNTNNSFSDLLLTGNQHHHHHHHLNLGAPNLLQEPITPEANLFANPALFTLDEQAPPLPELPQQQQQPQPFGEYRSMTYQDSLYGSPALSQSSLSLYSDVDAKSPSPTRTRRPSLSAAIGAAGGAGSLVMKRRHSLHPYDPRGRRHTISSIRAVPHEPMSTGFPHESMSTGIASPTLAPNVLGLELQFTDMGVDHSGALALEQQQLDQLQDKQLQEKQLQQPMLHQPFQQQDDLSAFTMGLSPLPPLMTAGMPISSMSSMSSMMGMAGADSMLLSPGAFGAGSMNSFSSVLASNAAEPTTV